MMVLIAALSAAWLIPAWKRRDLRELELVTALLAVMDDILALLTLYTTQEQADSEPE